MTHRRKGRFAGARIAVTGGARGIGLAITQAFHHEGARVALCDRDADAVASSVERLGAHALGTVLDVSDDIAVGVWHDALQHDWGGIDVLVSNAGIYPSKPFLDLSLEEWDQVIDVNLRAAFNVCQTFARGMRAAGSGGAIVTIASGSARFARVGAAHYCASKAGLVALTRVMALELAQHGIRVNAVSPGIVAVPDGPPLSAAYREAMTTAVPAGRMGTPEDVAAAVLSLADPDLSYVTGTELRVDGGLAAGRYGIPTSG
ncbi:MAG: SDR family oxidoreductase [Trueperaceae bacterium]|nr:MAG: SDR family oxidoreductase [Trueperaceae bacterium]